MKLYNFFRSGTSHRLRIALNLKNLPVEYLAVNLPTEQHLKPDYKAIHPQGFVPTLQLSDDTGLHTLIQTPAILEWLEERYPTPALLPSDAFERARVRALAAIVGCDIHPINNRRILQALRDDFKANEAVLNRWCSTWICAGFDAIESLLQADTRRGEFCFGVRPTMADVYLVPQVESARRFKVDVSRWPSILAVDAACAQLDAFKRAIPALQPDAA